MIWETASHYVDIAQPKDMDALAEVYNSHPAFLHSHLHRSAITNNWLMNEIKAMSAGGFWSCTVKQKPAGRVVGLLDVNVDKETYLSLLMVHHQYAHQGMGQQIYEGLEAYARDRECHTMWIDVVTEYDDRVMKFWTRNGFQRVNPITLEWDGVVLHAIRMAKTLS
ncbi:MAG: GNAT family N-acetyltransferase [Firmicutes bacterium]|nr:GNAT family N-acetyltransferase [Bacillota bacterium]